MITEPVRQIAEPKVQCRLIRSKWMFIEAEPDPTVPRSGTSICWCVHTQKVHGPRWPSRYAGGLQFRAALLRSSLAEIGLDANSWRRKVDTPRNNATARGSWHSDSACVLFHLI